MAGIGPTPMRLSHGTGSQLDFRRKKKPKSRWVFRGILAIVVIAALVRFAPMLRQTAEVDAPVTATEPRIIQMN